MQKVSGSYSQSYTFQTDTGKKTRAFTIKDSRKLNTIDVPFYIEYKAAGNLRLKAGPVLSIPLKQKDGKYSFQPDSLKKDSSALYTKTVSSMNKTKYQQKLGYGISAGVSYQVNRLIFEATYLKRLTVQKISSDLGSYQYNSNTLQFTVGFRLNKK